MSLPTIITNYWANNTLGLPDLWLEFAPQDQQPPIAVFEPEGFGPREYGNGGFWIDNYRYKFAIFQMDPVTAYTQGFDAVNYLNAITDDRIVSVLPHPETMATPAQVGQANVWMYEFSVDFKVSQVS